MQNCEFGRMQIQSHMKACKAWWHCFFVQHQKSKRFAKIRLFSNKIALWSRIIWSWRQICKTAKQPNLTIENSRCFKDPSMFPSVSHDPRTQYFLHFEVIFTIFAVVIATESFWWLRGRGGQVNIVDICTPLATCDGGQVQTKIYACIRPYHIQSHRNSPENRGAGDCYQRHDICSICWSGHLWHDRICDHKTMHREPWISSKDCPRRSLLLKLGCGTWGSVLFSIVKLRRKASWRRKPTLTPTLTLVHTHEAKCIVSDTLPRHSQRKNSNKCKCMQQ